MPIITYWTAAHVVLWNERIYTDDYTRGLISGLFFLLLLIAFVYESGYKKYYRFARKKYFYIVYGVPLCVALVAWPYEMLAA